MTDEPKENEQQQDDPIARANQAAARLEAANKHAEELEKRRRADMARDVLGGKTDAGQQPEKPKEETNAEYVERVMRDGKDTQRA